MKRVQALYQLWSQDPFFDEETRAELTALADQPQEIEERFYMDLAFGTAGLRGLLGAGTNRMNRYTVVRAADGFARFGCYSERPCGGVWRVCCRAVACRRGFASGW